MEQQIKKYINKLNPSVILAVLGIILLLCLAIAFGLRTYTILASQRQFTPQIHKSIHNKMQEMVSHTNVITLLEESARSKSIIVNTEVQTTGCNVALSLHAGSATNITISSSGLARIYRIYLPVNYTNTGKHALVLNFHGYGSTPAGQEAKSGFDMVADKDNFIVIYPEGTVGATSNRGWNTGLHPRIIADDVLFISNLLNQVQSNFCINASEIYATGFSNGGGFVNLLACKMAGRIAAFAPVSGSYITSPLSCMNTYTPSIMEFHGTLDAVNPYDGNPVKHEIGVQAWLADWAKVDGCSQEAHTTDGKFVAIQTWSDCTNDAAIVHYTLKGEMHTWPSWLFQQTSKNDPVIASTLIWEFFIAHPLHI